MAEYLRRSVFRGRREQSVVNFNVLLGSSMKFCKVSGELGQLAIVLGGTCALHLVDW
jgi:hypothetical protein